ncbi:cell division protein FtsA [Halothermothrix orenii]|uniref:Cell division protein FtsA n=1 Tax=Halothermothrix orenii (strain H 168 / OCM 544 / DSM 9562) TaxID=373903 RepID=B8CWJ9_HALOH|nr:cell division protein FtsA [Halothermothrix orenii]ACL69668.1 cell division protein FtsA [Halothermothrix orenii H 168]
MGIRRIITGLDIGTTKICAMIAEVNSEDKLDIIGIGLSPSHGLRKGIVVDIDKTSNAIKQAVEKAERMAGRQIDSAFVGIAGSHISSLNSHGVVAVSGEEKEIKPSDIQRVMEAAKIIPLSAEEEIIHVLAREFIVDGCPGIKDPLGMSGVRLEVETHIVTGSTTSIQNLVKSVLRAGLDVDDIVLEPLASSESVLTEDEKELGVALVDVGGGTTDLIVFQEGSITYTSVLPVGGNHVSNDIAVGLRTPIAEAEKIKIMAGSATTKNIGDDEYIEVVSASRKKKNKIPRKALCEVIEPRMQEIFNLVKRELDEVGPRDLTPAGVVLTGGASLLEGAEELASEVIGLPVRLGEPDYVNGLTDVIDNPVYVKKGKQVPKAIFSTAVGLVEYGLKYDQPSRDNNRGEIVSDFFGKLKNWFNDFF